MQNKRFAFWLCTWHLFLKKKKLAFSTCILQKYNKISQSEVQCFKILFFLNKCCLYFMPRFFCKTFRITLIFMWPQNTPFHQRSLLSCWKGNLQSLLSAGQYHPKYTVQCTWGDIFLPPVCCAPMSSEGLKQTSGAFTEQLDQYVD